MNFINGEELFNSEIKMRYLDSFDEEKTAYITSFMFKKAKGTEVVLKKDIYDMNKFELEEVVRSLSAATEYSAYIKTVQLEQYIDWAINNGYVSSNINPLSHIDKKAWSASFVARYKQQAFTRKDILKMSEELYNWVDKAVLLAIFEGIGGKGHAELLNLTRRDLITTEDKFFAKLKNKGDQERIIEISETLYDLLIRTDQEDEYYNKNGKAEGQDRYIKSQLLDSPYIFKKTTKGKQDNPLNANYIFRKLKIYKEVFGMPYLNSKHIEQSGWMYMAHELYQKDGGFKPEHLNIIAEHYDLTKTIVSGKVERVTGKLKSLLKLEQFEKLYGYKILN